MNLSAAFHGLHGISGSIHASKTSCGGATYYSLDLHFDSLLLKSSPLFLLRPFVFEMLLKLIEAFVPEWLVLMHPSRYHSQRFCSKRNHDLSTLSLPLDKSCSFENLEMLRHSVECRAVRLRNIQESRRSHCQLPNNRSPRRMRNGCQYV